jgi:molecular chaperone DnaK
MHVDRNKPSLRPAVRLGVDFGPGVLVIGSAGPEGSGYRTLPFPGWSEELPGSVGVPVHGIPALVHYGEEGTPMIGSEVVLAGRTDHPATARWIRNYLLDGSPVQIPAGAGRRVTFRDAAAVLLTAALTRAVRDHPGTVSVHFAVPPGAPAWYAGWLGDVARASGCASWHTTDEPTAAAAGYGLPVEEGASFVLVRLDETALEVSVLLKESSGVMRVAGTASGDTGCRALDGWIAGAMRAGCGPKFAGAKGQWVYDGILGRLGVVYGQLAAGDGAVLEIAGPLAGTSCTARFSRADLGRCLEGHGFAAILDRTVGRACAAARSRGCDGTPVAVLMTGRGGAIPAVQVLVRARFPGADVRCDRPFDAVARGAACCSPPVDREDRIVNDYALRYWDAAAREHRYRFLVRGGARYPSAGQVARITISAAYDGQCRLGIPLYECGTVPGVPSPAIELVSDPAGGIRLAGPSDDPGADVRPVLVNGRTPTLLVADPPALKGDPRFELTFTLDQQRQLCVTARDLRTGTLVKKDVPVYRLT